MIAAGRKNVRGPQEGSEFCLKFEERPQTPPELKRFRSSSNLVPGEVLQHYGLANDKIPSGPYGVKNSYKPGESCEASMNVYPTSKTLQWKLERADDIYKSTKTEPLGKSMTRGHKIPLEPDHSYGIHVGAEGKNRNPESGLLINPSTVETNDPEHHNMYVMTHQDFLPGEQRSRNYDWNAAGVDPKKNVFGIKDLEPYYDGVAKSINPNLNGSAKTKIVNKLVEEFKDQHAEKLGTAKNLGARDQRLPKDHTYGLSSQKFEEWGVFKLLGSYTKDEQLPDADLGKSIKPGFRNIAPEDKVFGAPTVRSYIPAPKTRSVADNNNYGDEPNTMTLLYPSNGAERGITEEDFLLLRSKDSIKALMAAVKAKLSDAEFDKIYETASNSNGQCSLSNFLHAKDNATLK